MTVEHRNAELLSRAVSLHQAGNLDEAETLYRTILSSDSNHSDALTLLGTVYLQRGHWEEGARLIGLSLEINPTQPAAFNNRGNALRELKRPAEALASFDRAVALNPGYAEAFYNRGNVLNDLKRPAEALASYDRAIALNPGFFKTHNNRGNALLDLNRHAEALASFDRAVALNPGYSEAYGNRGLALSGLKKHIEALASFDRAVALNPGYVEAWCNRGNALLDLKRTDEALASYDRAISMNPAFVKAHNNRGNALLELKRLPEALASYDRAIALEPGYPDAWNNRGNSLHKLRRLPEALASFDRAIALSPGYADACYNRGNALLDLKQPDEALASFDRAIALSPGFAKAWNNRGTAFLDMKRTTEALASFDQAIAQDSNFAEAYFNKGLLKLLLGEYEEGWKLYEWRWKTEEIIGLDRNFPQPLWTGDASLAGKTILLHAEQGFGDSLQMCRYAPMVAALGANVLLEVHPSLAGLMSTLGNSMRVIPRGSPLPGFDFHCPLMSLPLAFKTTADSIPAKVPYLATDTDKRKQWEMKLGAKTKSRLGLAWSGAPTHKNDLNRSIPLSLLDSLLDLDFEFHCLQKEIKPEEKELLWKRHRISTHENDLNDFSDTAALTGQMDLVISVDTSLVHLAGALGKPVWILLPFVPDFRWLLEREDSPWYPCARLWRQPEIGDWTSVIAGVVAGLKAL